MLLEVENIRIMRENIWREVIRDIKHLELEEQNFVQTLLKNLNNIQISEKNTSNIGTNYLVRAQAFQGEF